MTEPAPISVHDRRLARFDAAFRDHYEAVRRHAARRGSPEPDDAVASGAERAWLLATARKLAANQRRAVRRRASLAEAVAAGSPSPVDEPPEANAIFQREYAAAQRSLTLPPGVTWPARTIPPDTAIGIGRGGAGESTAVLSSLDAWTCDAVRRGRAGDAAGVRTALAALTDLVDHHIRDVPSGMPEDGAAPSGIPGPLAQFAAGDEPTQVIWHRWISAAAAGDMSDLAQSCRANGTP